MQVDMAVSDVEQTANEPETSRDHQETPVFIGITCGVSQFLGNGRTKRETATAKLLKSLNCRVP
jgi:hypothetical protein